MLFCPSLTFVAIVLLCLYLPSLCSAERRYFEISSLPFTIYISCIEFALILTFPKVALNHRVAKYILQDSDDVIESCPPQIICVLDLLIHLPHFYRILNEANDDEIPETACSELTHELKIIFDQSMTYGLESTINVKPLFLKMERRTGRNYLSENLTPVIFI